MKLIVNKLLLAIASLAPYVTPAVGIIFCSLLFTGKDNNILKSQSIRVEAGINIDRDPLQAVQEAIELVKNISNVRQEIDKEESIEPISFRDFIEYLPEPPSGWIAEEPEGETTSFGDYSVSQVKQTYTKERKKITISIFDWAFNSALYTPLLLTTEFSQESTEGYNKAIKIGDILGREEYTYANKNGSLNLLVNRRFLVQIEGSNIENTELRKWWKLIDEGSLTKINSE